MAFGDPIGDEGISLLPGGSRVEALELDTISPRMANRSRHVNIVNNHAQTGKVMVEMDK